MRIGIDATLLGTGAGGTDRYVRNLIRELAAIAPQDELILYAPTPSAGDLRPAARHVRSVTLPSRADGGRARFAFSRTVANAHLDVMGTQVSAPFLFGAPFVVTIHDLYHEHYAHLYTPRQLATERLRTALTLRRAAAVIADSDYTKGDIVRFYRIRPDKVTVVPLAADPLFRPIHEQARLQRARERYAHGRRFILSVGALKETKNVRRLVEAYVALRQAGRVQHPLVLVGPKTVWLDDDVIARAQESSYAEDIIFTGRIPDDDVVTLYNAADLFVHAALFEGFGLPPLEAMACGSPVIASAATATPEVVGDAAVLIDPLDVPALAAAIARVLGDHELRQDLARRSLDRAAAFTWEATARMVHRVYREVASSQGVVSCGCS